MQYDYAMRIFVQSLLLIVSFSLAYLWEQTPLGDYTWYAVAVLIAFFLILSFRKKQFNPTDAISADNPLGIFALTTIILFMIFSTNGLGSPLFFLLYFLSFGIALVFEPITILVFILGIILVFMPDMLQNDLMGNVIRIGSVLLISPLAFFFGKEFRRDEAQQEELEAMSERSAAAGETISNEIGQVLENEKTTLKAEDVEKLNEILEQADDLRQESKNSI